MADEGVPRTSGLGDAICARLVPAPTPEVRESVLFFADHLESSLALGFPDALTDQLHWQTRRLRHLAPLLDAEQLAEIALAVVREQWAEADYGATSTLLDHAVDGLSASFREVDAPDAAFGDLARDYLELALAGEHDRAADLVVESGLSPHHLLLRVLEPAQAELGRRWEGAVVSVAQEHETTALTQRVLSMLRDRRPRVASIDRTVYAALVGEEQHSVGLDMVVDLLEGTGWRVHRAVGAVDTARAVEEVARVRPDVVALSVTLFKHVVEVRSVVAALRSDERTRHVPVVVGGRPFRQNPALAELVGADDWAEDGQGALEACRRSAEPRAERHLNDVTREMVTPLETMLGLAALLQEDESLTHRQRDLAQRIIRAGGQLMTTLEDLGHGLIVVHGGPDERSSQGLVDLDELVEALLVRHQGRAAQRDIVMRQIRIPPNRGRAMVEGDVSQLERVIDTMLENAVSVTPTSGVVTVRVKRAGDLTSVAVADEGPAVPVGSREAIFDPERATHSAGATDIGPWRGLAVCRRIAEQHEGTVTATSDHRGAVFTLTLPLSRRMLVHEADAAPAYPPLAVVREQRSRPTHG